MNFKMICISNHNIMLLATSLLRIHTNYVLSGMYEIGDCLFLFVLALFYHSSYPSLYVNFAICYLYFHLLNRGISSTDIFVFWFFPLLSTVPCILRIYADEYVTGYWNKVLFIFLLLLMLKEFFFKSMEKGPVLKLLPVWCFFMK